VNLAGFDAILEFSRGLLEDTFLSTTRDILPGGDPNDTFAPPFSWPLSITASGANGDALVIVKQVQLIGVAGSTTIQLRFSFADSSLNLSLLPGPLSLIAGELVLTAQLSVGLNAGNTSLNLNTGSAIVTCDFTNESKTKMNAQIPGLADLIRTAIENQLQQQIRTVASTTLAPLPFTINSSSNSEIATVVTVLPSLRWITAEVLGLFAMYRLVPAGNPALKSDTDLEPGQRRSVAALLSPQGFQQVYGCPTVRQYVRDTVGAPILQNNIAQEKAMAGNTGEPTPAQKQAAIDKLNMFLSSPDGVRLLADQTPSPCGNGSLTQHVNPPDPFPGTDAHVREISLALEPQRIRVHFRADAEIFCGDVEVQQTLHFPISANYGTIKIGEPIKDAPSTNVSGGLLCKAALAAVGAAVGGLTGGLAGFFALVFVHMFLEDPVGKKIAEIAFKPGSFSPNVGVPVSWRTLVCDETGLRLSGVVYGVVADPTPFEPTVEITVAQKKHLPSIRPLPEGETDQLTGVVCVPPRGTKFHFTRGVANWEITLGIQSKDVPLPLTVGTWYLQFGYRTKSFGYTMVHFDEARYPISPGPLIVWGTVWNPEPPLSGELVENTNIHLEITAAPKPGFVLKTQNTDLNYFLWVTTTVVDAANNVWDVAKKVAVDGKSIVLGDDAKQFIKDCEKHLKDLNDRFAKSHVVPPWDQRTDLVDRLREDLMAGLRHGTVGLASALGEASAKIGEKTVFNLILGNKGRM
jgi:hypothetical protein